MVAGGVGLAPFVTLAEAIRSSGGRARLFYGARRASELYYVELFERIGVEVVLTTEDGSRGEHGLRHRCARHARFVQRRRTSDIRLYVCGPTPMMRAVAELASTHGAACDVSLEQVMGCGLGGCYSCVVLARDPTGAPHYLRSCIDGPVFDAHPGSSGTHSRTDMDLSVAIGTLTLPNPLIAASGCFGYGVEYADIVDLATLGGVAVKGLFLAEREGHAPPRIVETPAGMLNAIGLQGIGVHRFVREKLPELRDRRAIVIREHLRHDHRRVLRDRADPVGPRGRRRDRAEHLLPEHQAGRHHLRLQPDRHP